MRHFLRRFCCLFLALTLLASLCAAAGTGAFSDTAGHWAEETLKQAVSDGLLSGFEDGTMRPNAPITQAQILAILCRVLGVQSDAAPETLGLTGREWYASAALGAAELDLLTDTTGLNAPMTRGDALVLLCRALGLGRAEPDRTVLQSFSETDVPDEIASLAAQGLVQGYNGSLNLTGSISRAEFVTVLYRAMGQATARQDSTYALSGETFSDGLWFGCGCTSISLSAVTAPAVVVRAQALSELRLRESTDIGRLVLAGGGDVNPSVTGGSRIGVLAVLESGGKVTAPGGVERVELAGAGRSLTVTGRLTELVVTGEGCTVQINSGASVDTLRILGGGCMLRNNGSVKALTIDGADSAFAGSGNYGGTTINTIFSQPPKNPGKLTDHRDFGIEGASITVTAPEALPMETVLEAEAIVSLPAGTFGKTAEIQWYLGDQCLGRETVTLAEKEQRFSLSNGIQYNQDLPEQAPVELRLLYVGREVSQTVSGQSEPVAVENHDPAYYQALEAERVLALVDTGYEGDYTLAWAEANDYTDADKALWVNAKGFESETEYLIWVSLKYQRCNIFQGAQGSWKLIRSGIVGTGAPGSPTPEGVWKTTYKQEHGWTTATYTVKPVVRFKGGGYAFHSRLYRPNSATLSDPSIGFPISHGCVRMYDEDIQWIFNTVPEGTTVVVF